MSPFEAKQKKEPEGPKLTPLSMIAILDFSIFLDDHVTLDLKAGQAFEAPDAGCAEAMFKSLQAKWADGR